MDVNGYSELLLLHKLEVTKAKLPPHIKPPILKITFERWTKYVTHTHKKNPRHGEQEMTPNSSHKTKSLALGKAEWPSKWVRQAEVARLRTKGKVVEHLEGVRERGWARDCGCGRSPRPPARMVVGGWVGEMMPVNLSGNNLRIIWGFIWRPAFPPVFRFTLQKKTKNPEFTERNTFAALLFCNI